jgi:tetraacyldisaccharide 4'-kinase
MNFTDLLNPYAYAMKLRRLLYRKKLLRSHRVSVPVISIGNLSMGGTGKTPVTMYIAKYCIESTGKKTAIVLRGYKRKSSGYLLVSDGKNVLASTAQSGDEAQLYAQGIPEAIVICDEDRIRGARNAIKLGAEIILLDDGFQHIRIDRDLNILLINAEEGIPPTLPFGRGREGASAIQDADIVILTNSGNTYDIQLEIPIIKIQTKISDVILYNPDGSSKVTPDIFRDKSILALSGIAHPERFSATIAPFAKSILPYSLEDHAEYDASVLADVITTAKKEQCNFIATTTKDAVKMLDQYRALQQKDTSIPQLAVIHTEIEFIDGEEILKRSIRSLLEN